MRDIFHEFFSAAAVPVLLMHLPVLLMLTGCGGEDTRPVESIADIQKREGVPVRIVTMQPEEIRIIEKNGGTVEGYYQTTLGAGVDARIVAINVEVGENVSEDQVLIELDREAMSSQYIQAKAAYDQAKKSHQRIQVLAEEGGAAEDVLDQTETNLKIARANFNAARKGINVLAPFHGTVVELFEEENRNIESRTPLITIARLDTVRVKMRVNEVEVDKFEMGQRAFIELQGDTLSGTIVEVSMAGYDMNHSFLVESVFANPGERLKPGTFVTVHTVVHSSRDAYSLPVDVVLTESGQHGVFVVREGKAWKVPVKVGIRGGSDYEITEGLKTGDQVVLEGASRLSDGAPVKVIDGV
jgi:RND family efflux transporter MFP subunit